MWRICLRSPIICTYNQSLEKELTIVIRHYYFSLGFICVSISHICNNIYCSGFDFDRIRFITVQCLIRFYFILIGMKIKFQYYVPVLTQLWVDKRMWPNIGHIWISLYIPPTVLTNCNLLTKVYEKMSKSECDVLTYRKKY